MLAIDTPPESIAAVLQRAESGVPIAELARKAGHENVRRAFQGD